jgi:bilirubin oxidase
MKRRDFIRSALAGVGGLVVGCGGGDDGNGDGGAATDAAALVPGQPLRGFAVLANESADARQFVATITAAPGFASLAAGQATGMWLYNGMLPGPLVELYEGQRVRIRFDNALPEESTIHWHGLLVPAAQDGNPMDPVPAGTSRYYEYDVPFGTAGTYWYHPHPHDNTAAQVMRGLAAPLIIRAADDPLAELPETTLFFTGVRLDDSAQIPPDNAIDWTIGRQGEQLLVNGSRLPVLTLRPGTTQRLRLVNATHSRHFRFAIEGHTLTLVGTDGGLLGAPVTGLTELLIAPAQRYEVLVKVSAVASARYRVRGLGFQSDFLGLGTYPDVDLMTLATTAEPPAPEIAIPQALRPIADLGVATVRRPIELSEVTDICTRSGATTAFLINGKLFDPNRIDIVSNLGDVELWEIHNDTAMPHPFHIHGTQFQLVSRQIGNVVTPAPYLAWLDTVLVPSQHRATIKVRQTMPGKRMFHCHILEHEDNCMMAILDVRA